MLRVGTAALIGIAAFGGLGCAAEPCKPTTLSSDVAFLENDLPSDWTVCHSEDKRIVLDIPQDTELKATMYAQSAFSRKGWRETTELLFHKGNHSLAVHIGERIERRFDAIKLRKLQATIWIETYEDD